MALTITIEGKGVIANCDALTNDTGGTGTGDWTEQGGGTMTLSPDVYLYGTGSIGGKYASKSGMQQFDLGVGNELDFSPGGTEEGQFIYMWVNMAAFGSLDTLANYGLAIRISSSSPGTTNYVDYRIGDATDANGWTGGWKLFVIDPSIAGSRVSGTQATIIASVVTLGIWIDTASSVRAESLWIDQIAVGSGLRMVGTYDSATYEGAWEEAVAYCTDFTNRAWGMLQERDGIYYAFGKMYIGDAAQTAITSFKDSGRVIQFGTSQFYGSGNTWISSFGTAGAGVVVEDHASFTTTFEDGILVGTDQGRSGSTIIGNIDQNVSVDLYGGNNAASVTSMYGTTFNKLTGTFVSGNDAQHSIFSCNFVKCQQFDPVGAPVIRNCVFSEVYDDGVADATKNSALLWNTNIDIQDCQFISNSHIGTDIAHAIEHSVAETVTYTNLFFSDNEVDVHFSATTGNLIIGITGGDSPSTTNDSTGTITINNFVTVSLSGVSEGTPVKVIANETVGTITTGDIILEIFADSTGEGKTTAFNYEGAFDPTGLSVLVKARNSGVAVAAIAEDNGTGFTDETSEASSNSTLDMTLLPATPALNDAYYFAHAEQFNQLRLVVSTILTQTVQPTITWEYWNGSSWGSLSGVSDGTSGFEILGENVISFTLPGDWSTTTINSQGPLYYIRSRLSTVGTITQVPIGAKVTLDTTRYLPYAEERIITSSGLFDIAAWTVDSIGKF